MRRALIGLVGLAAGLLAGSAADAQQSVKIGLIMPYSGQFADTAAQMDNAIKLYVKEHGDTVAGKKIEFIRKDSGGIAPDVAKRLAQEMVVRDKVDILGGLILTPNALAVGDISAEAKKFTVIMNAATSIITTKSPYMARTSVTTPMLNQTLGTWAATKGGVKKVFTMVSDSARAMTPKARSISASRKRAARSSARCVSRWPIRIFPLSCSAPRTSNADAIYIWIPGGAQPAAIAKALFERGIDPKKTKILGQDVVGDNSVLKGLGDASIGIITVANYDYNHDSAKNKAFVKGFREISGGRNPDIFSIGGYDGMHLIYEALKKTNGNADGDALITAAKGMAWESPRGPMSIDPETRDVVQTIYVRRVDRIGDGLGNVEFDKLLEVKDPVKARMKK